LRRSAARRPRRRVGVGVLGDDNQDALRLDVDRFVGLGSALIGFTITSLCVGGYHALVLASNQPTSVYAWGDNNHGQLGVGSLLLSRSAVQVA